MKRTTRNADSKLVLIVVTAILSGCSSLQYSPPPPIADAPSSVIVNQPVDRAWQTAVAGIAKSFFIVNTMERSSGYISLSYAGDPEEFVNCGQAHFTNLNHDATWQIASNKGGPAGLQRTVTLEGRINVLVQPTADGHTSISVKARYLLHQHAVETGAFKSAQPVTDVSAVFDTNQSGKFGAFTCRPTGALETRAEAALSAS